MKPRIAAFQDWVRTALRRALHGRMADSLVALLSFGTIQRARAHQGRRPHGAQPGQRCILVIDDRIPFPWLGAGFPRSAELLKQLVLNEWHVTFLPSMHITEDPEVVKQHFPAEIEFLANPAERTFASILADMVGVFDVVVVSRPHNMEMLRAACRYVPRFSRDLPIIYDAEALITEREALRRKIKNIPWAETEYRQALRDELRIVRGADLIFTVNDYEKSLIAPHTRAHIHVLSHAVASHPAPPGPEGRTGLLFVGGASFTSDISPNTDSLVWFIQEVMPILLRTLGPDLVLHVAGRIESEEVAALAGPNVRLHGMVPDLAPLYDTSRLFIAPTRFAAGIPLKVLEASAQGLPVVATPLIARQLGRTDGTDILIGGTAAEFAAACHRLYTDDDLWRSVHTAALSAVERECNPGMFAKALLGALASLPARQE